MSLRTRIVLLTISAMLFAVLPLAAQFLPPPFPQINSASINYAVSPNTITILGSNFSPTGVAPSIVFAQVKLTLVSSSQTTLVANLPTTLVPGTYTMVVTTSRGLPTPYMVTFGAVGPQGLPGFSGAQGLQGPAGAMGATGPQGPIGPPGPQGIVGPAGGTGSQGLTYQGVWKAATTYALNDAVSFSGSSYISLAGANMDNEPDTNPTSWSRLALGFNWRGEWSNTAVYALNDVVSFSGASWVSVMDANTNYEPDIFSSAGQPTPIGPQPGSGGTSTGPEGTGPQPGSGGTSGGPNPIGPQPGQVTIAWALLAARGAAGSIGAQGLIGPQGPAGSQGPQGLTGASGPQGPSGVANGLTTNVYGSYSYSGIYNVNHTDNFRETYRQYYTEGLGVNACGYRSWGDQIAMDFYVQWAPGTFTYTPTCFASLSGTNVPPKQFAPVVTNGANFSCAGWGGMTGYDALNSITVSIATDESCAQIDKLAGVCSGWNILAKAACNIASAAQAYTGDAAAIASATSCQSIGCSLPNLACIITGGFNFTCMQ